jgi:hypothetical protein
MGALVLTDSHQLAELVPRQGTFAMFAECP